ncbi:MAG: GntR family transcriptional regulator / MocR family aminotransferase [Solirubrobacteraceae bacterium]|nr:GntR family transcriptional regulator / MocR family aminotransferase [Solirubrobacteraceae bacterium]
MLEPVDLLVDPRRPAGGSLRRQLEREIREAVQAGRLLPGSAMPSTRALAAQLGVSRGLVVETYAQLVAEGYLSARQGAATVVAARAVAAGRRPQLDRPPPAAAVPRFDFRYGTPDLSAFPRAAWLAAGNRRLRALPDTRLGYGDPRGTIELRSALAAYLGRARGVLADPEHLLIGGGTRYALGLFWRVLFDAGARRIGIEDPGWSAQGETARDAGLQVVPVAVDERGMRVQDLASLDIDAVVLTPAHQCPTGVVLSPERRVALLDWARGRDAVVVEDDYDAEYRYDRDPVGALQGMAPEQVVYAGSASKTLSPALRLGWLLLPPRFAAAAARRKALDDRGAPLFDQLALADLLASGELDRHLRRTRRRYRDRRDALVAAVQAELPGASVEGIAAGLHALVRLPARADEAATVAAAAARGIALEGLATFRRSDTPAPPALVIGYGNLSERAITRGIGELARTLR